MVYDPITDLKEITEICLYNIQRKNFHQTHNYDITIIYDLNFNSIIHV